MATKWFFMPLTLLILGKQQVKCKNIDVYLQPFIEELQELWEPSVITYEFSKPPNDMMFTL
jgi:hypothetical protein